MGSPPQGYIASQLSIGTWVTRLNANGNLAVFHGTSPILQVMEWVAGNSIGNSALSGTWRGADDGTLVIDTKPGRDLWLANDTIVGGNLTDLQFGNQLLTIAAGGSVNRYHNEQTAAAALGLPAISGIDNRTGISSADGAPITLFTVPAGTAGQLFRITADIFATAVTGGTANYTITWTENAGSRTMVVSASVVNTLATATDLINPDSSTTITAQLTFAAFTGTVKVASIVERIAQP